MFQYTALPGWRRTAFEANWFFLCLSFSAPTRVSWDITVSFMASVKRNSTVQQPALADSREWKNEV